eukprot:TRINITY_DN100343_c0_g1_i1.p1 TRINITY_DN100343_c0_g1~~TRINITY_DN100343_c0_g1_i1.p1  ORF type:complete len:134 (-),score=35.41 TRINITY_DN100343_c0_g1_i1:323-724(-)
MKLSTTYACPAAGGRRLREEGRRLSETLDVKYQISIPAAEAKTAASTLEKKINSITKEALTTELDSQMQTAGLKASDFGVTVTTIAAPTVSAPGATTTTTTQTLPAGQSAATHAAKLEMLLAVLAGAAVLISA